MVCPNGQIGLQFSGGEGGMRRLSNNKELNKNKKEAIFIIPFYLTRRLLWQDLLSIHPSIHLFLGFPFTCFELFVLFCFFSRFLTHIKSYIREFNAKTKDRILLFTITIDPSFSLLLTELFSISIHLMMPLLLMIQ